ncbi:MAG: VOC family protein [Gemmatimonadales bacterium]
MNGLRLHHVGIAVSAIEPNTEIYIERFGYISCGDIVHDPVQTAYVQFLRLPGDHVFVEFVAPDGPESKLTNAIKRGGGLNHLCYATPDIDATSRELRAGGMMLVHSPTPAAAFHGRRIAWMLGRDRILIELVEQGAPGEL